jgi:hypothetical protein
LILTSLPVPAAEEHSHSMMLPPLCFTVGMVPGFLQTLKLGIQAKEFNLGFIRPENPLDAFWQTPTGLSCAFY